MDEEESKVVGIFKNDKSDKSRPSSLDGKTDTVVASENPVSAENIAVSILHGFDFHYTHFLKLTRSAKTCFENSDWAAESDIIRDRIQLYKTRVSETVEHLRNNYDLPNADVQLWRNVKRKYLGLLYTHKQPELAETFYNSVFTWLFERRYYHNDNIFVRPGASTEYLDGDNPVYFSLYPTRGGLKPAIRSFLESIDIKLPFANLSRDIRLLMSHIKRSVWPELVLRRHFHIQMIKSPFYRNKAMYLVGRAVNGEEIRPFIIPILINDQNKIEVDALLTKSNDIANIFSMARAYFMVDTDTPASVVTFLNEMLPTKSKADLYTSIGLQKQGKTDFYRELLHHLQHSDDLLELAPGIKGMVMTVFNLPSYPYVFKVIKDKFEAPKTGNRQTVRGKYQIVKLHDRVGRMADTLEFSYVALPINRFSDELLEELKREIPSMLKFDEENVVIRHIYIERRLEPLNLFLAHATDDQKADAILGYGNAIKDMAAVNIFPGDLLFKNFGVTSHGRVIFYDYDEIEFMTDCNFRYIPPPRYPEDEMASEPWYSIAPHDVFPEEFAYFIFGDPVVREAFMEHHSDLLDADYWKNIQSKIEHGYYPDFYPYKSRQRFRNIYPEYYCDR